MPRAASVDLRRHELRGAVDRLLAVPYKACRMAGADALAREELAAIAANGLLRSLEPLRTGAGAEVELASGERLVSFSSNDYLGLASHPAVRQALADGARQWGAGAGASRLVCGDYLPHHELEQELAKLEGTESAVLFNSGYAANCGVVPTFAGPEDAVLSDALNHASLVDGCRLSRARTEVYPHSDVAALEAALRRARQQGARRVLVATDTVFSMDGDLAPLAQIAEACERHGALLVADEAHTALRILEGAEGDALRARLRRNVERFAVGLRALGLPAEAATPIFPVVLGAPEAALSASAQLRKRGLLVKPIRPPTVPAGSSRLRIALTAAHTDAHLDLLLSALREAA